MLGLSGVHSFASDWQITLDSVYNIAGRGSWAGRSHQYGNSINYSLKAYNRILPKEIGEKNLFVFLGASGESAGKEKGTIDASGTYDASLVNLSTGGTVLYGDIGLRAVMSADTILNLGFSKSFFHDMNFDTSFEPDPAPDYKIDIALTYMF